ncbi:MAG: SARP family transcriptional regulator [Roseiflexus castenholzii]|uniref:BTAD domain-containing putative transcriptional regulator n=1 Tax=Roseiflexus castenholzii TaxID=120962 RepID=UPI000CBB3DA7|nr:MAG: SARP family transcriptional regulator [Roseiflexus castenholzii]
MPDAHHSNILLELKLFGAPRLLLDRREVPFRRRQPLAIMAVLAISERPVTRDELTYLLWPDSPHAVARQRLRRSLSQLRQAVEPWADRLLTGAGSSSHLFRFDPNVCHIDARTFLHLSGQARELPDPDGLRAAEQSTRLYTGPLLSGLELDTSPEFEQWLFQQRERFERIQLDMWRRIVDGYTYIGDFPRAIAAVEHALSMDALSEELHRKAMWLYAKTGRRSEAIRQFAHCASLLKHELGIEPDADTATLYRAILDDQSDDAQSFAFGKEPRAQSSASVAPLAARNVPVAPHAPDNTFRYDELVAAMHRALTGATLVACIQGPAGAGKSRLVREALERIRWMLPNVMVWSADARKTGHAVPFGPMADLFDAALRERLNRPPGPSVSAALQADRWMTEALRLQPDLRAVFPHLLPLSLQSGSESTPHWLAHRRLLQALPRALHALKGDDPTVIVLEDLDQADPLSIEATGWLMNRLPDMHLALVITCRTIDGTLAEMLDHLRTRGMLQMLSIPAFDQAMVLHLAENAGLPATLAEAIWRQAHGAPLATREMLYAAILSARHAGELRIPSSLHEALLAHLQSFDSTTRQVLEAVAVLTAGSTSWIHHVSGRTVEEVDHTCERLIDHDWLKPVGAWYAIAHPEVHTVVLKNLSPVRRQWLYRQAATLLRQHSADPAQIAYHLEAADQPGEAAEMWLQAARHARSLYARDAALVAIQHGLRLAPDRQMQFDLLSEQEAILHDHGLRTEQEMALAALEDLIERSPDHPEWRAEIFRKRGRYALARNDWGAAVEALRRAATLTLHNDDEILCLLARALTHAQQWDAARDMVQRALSLAQQRNDRDALVRGWLTYTDVEQGCERFDAAENALKQAVHLAGRASPMLPNLMLALGNLVGVRNDFDSALLYAQEARRLFAQHGLPDREAAAGVLAARMLVRLGRLDEALAAYQSAYVGYAAIDLRQGMAAGRVNACVLALRMGELEQGVHMAQEAYDLFQSINDARGLCVAASNIGAALVWMGRGAEAEVWLRESYERAKTLNLPAQQAAALANLGAALLQQSRTTEAHQVMEQGLALREAQGHIDVSIDRAFLSIACLRQGDIDAADAQSARALDDLKRMPHVENPQQVWFARAQTLYIQGRLDEARDALASAVDCLRHAEQQQPPSRRERYLTAFAFNRAILRAAAEDIWPDPPMLV